MLRKTSSVGSRKTPIKVFCVYLVFVLALAFSPFVQYALAGTSTDTAAETTEQVATASDTASDATNDVSTASATAAASTDPSAEAVVADSTAVTTDDGTAADSTAASGSTDAALASASSSTESSVSSTTTEDAASPATSQSTDEGASALTTQATTDSSLTVGVNVEENFAAGNYTTDTYYFQLLFEPTGSAAYTTEYRGTVTAVNSGTVSNWTDMSGNAVDLNHLASGNYCLYESGSSYHMLDGTNSKATQENQYTVTGATPNYGASYVTFSVSAGSAQAITVTANNILGQARIFAAKSLLDPTGEASTTACKQDIYVALYSTSDAADPNAMVSYNGTPCVQKYSWDTAKGAYTTVMVRSIPQGTYYMRELVKDASGNYVFADTAASFPYAVSYATSADHGKTYPNATNELVAYSTAAGYLTVIDDIIGKTNVTLPSLLVSMRYGFGQITNQTSPVTVDTSKAGSFADKTVAGLTDETTSNTFNGFTLT